MGPGPGSGLLEKGSLEPEGEASFKVRLEHGDASATIRITPRA